MGRRSPVLLAVCGWLVVASACEPAIDLATGLKLVSALTGYYDNGLNANKESHYLPSITFQLKNEADTPLANVDVTVAFWTKGDAGHETDSKFIRGIRSTPLAPGATSEPITVRATVGYTSPIYGDGIFKHPEFKDMIVKVFAKRQGKTTKLDERDIDRRVLPSVPSGVPAGGSRP
jgi:hypothetical protein